MRARSLLAAVLAAAPVAIPRGGSLPDGYAVRTAFLLSPSTDHGRGRLELLEDARITARMRDAIGEAYGGDPCREDPAPVLRALCTTPRTPLRPALLRLLDGSGRVVATREAERPLADLTAMRLHGSVRRTFIFTVDLSAGIGSYS